MPYSLRTDLTDLAIVTRPIAPSAGSSSGPPPPGQIKSLEEIEADMSRVAVTEPVREPKVLTLEEIEQEMMATPESPREPTPQRPPPQREATPTQMPALAGSGYASQKALLDSMFPELGTSAIPGQPTASLLSGASKPSPEDLARMEAIHERITEKITAMARYNNLMGSSDKDFITRIQLSQLASADPYASDFYAQVFSALKRSRLAAANGGEGPTIVQVAPGFGVGAAGPTGNRFGKMGTNTMQRLSTQVKKLVENRAQHQKGMGTGELSLYQSVTNADWSQPLCKVLLAVSPAAILLHLDLSLPYLSGTSRKIARPMSSISRPVRGVRL